jgi:predicted dehydrogenase
MMIKFAMIGTGIMAANMMEAFKLVPDVQVVAVLSTSSERAKNFANQFNIPKYFDALDVLLENSNIDAVYIANATESHFETTMAALKNGKAVLCEKPIALSEVEAKQIEDAAKQANVLCMEAMWTHCLPAYQQLFTLSQTKNYGKPKHLYADFGYPVNPKAQPRLFANTQGSGVLLDRGVYPIALAIKLFGNVESVSSQVNYNATGVDTHATLLLTHENGLKSTLSVSIEVLLQNTAILSCTKGAISLAPPVIGAETVVTQSFYVADVITSAASGGLKNRLKQTLKQSTLLRKLKSLKAAGRSHYYTYGANQYVPVLAHFSALFHAGKKQSPHIPLTLSTEVLRVIDLVKKLND